MTAAMKAPTSFPLQFLGTQTRDVASLLNEELMSRFVPVFLLIPKSAVMEATEQEELEANEHVACARAGRKTASPLNACKSANTDPNPPDTFAFGEVTVSFSAMETHCRGKLVTLTSKEFKALAYFIKNPRKVISRDELLNQVWGYECYPCTRTVDNHILHLRRKLENEPTSPKHFQTVHGVGYKFLP